MESPLIAAPQKEAKYLYSNSLWPLPPGDLILRNDEVHVWRAPLVQGASRFEKFRRLLSEDEQARAARFYFQKDRAHFIVARGMLRIILGHYLNVAAADLRFGYSFYGMPALAEEFTEKQLRFNMSHSHGLALFAITSGREIGVDLEQMRPEFADEHIAERFFSAREVEDLRSLPSSMQREAFFNCWTRKEAYIKARGEGLSFPLERFDVSLAPGEPAALLVTRDDPREAARWSLRELFPGHGYKAALAVEGNGWQLKCWRWPEG